MEQIYFALIFVAVSTENQSILQRKLNINTPNNPKIRCIYAQYVSLMVIDDAAIQGT